MCSLTHWPSLCWVVYGGEREREGEGEREKENRGERRNEGGRENREGEEYKGAISTILDYQLHTCFKMACTAQSKSPEYFSLRERFSPQNSVSTFNSIIGLASSCEGGAPGNLGAPNSVSSILIQ